MKSMWLVVCWVGLVGCPLQTKSSSTLPSSAGSSNSGGAGSSGSSSAPTSFYNPETHSYDDSDEPVIVGLTVEEASKKIRAQGVTGEIEVVKKSDFDKDCKTDTVCGFDPRRWYKIQPNRVTLYVNRKVEISVPD